MATKIRNVSGQDLVVPWLGHRTVTSDEVVEVPDDDAPAYLEQVDTWREVGSRKSKSEDA